MLSQITIQNLAIIEKVSLSLDPGLNILTGETGAGKSIIIDAVESVLGGRTSGDMVRSGETSMLVAALFDDVPVTSSSLLTEWGFEPSPEVLLEREVTTQGRSYARINGRPSTLAMLRQLGHTLVDLHGQGEHQQLLDRRRHIDLLDGFAGPLAAEKRQRVAMLHAHIQKKTHELRTLTDQKEMARQIDLLGFQVKEIDEAQLREGEESALDLERKVLGSAKKLLDASSRAYELVYQGERGALPAIDAVEKAHALLADLSDIDERVKPVVEAVEQAKVWLQELSIMLRSYREQVQVDPARLAFVEERLSFLAQMKRKYGDTIAEIAAFREQAALALEALQHSDELALEIRADIDKTTKELTRVAIELHELRSTSATQVSSLVAVELEGLGMKGTVFEVSVTVEPDSDGIFLEGQRVKVSPSGIDAVEFLLSPNAGEAKRSLTKIASGGEASRIMLAMKAVLARSEGIPTLIFDEIDAGVGGETAYSLGQKLAELGKLAQVLCVTHLAQVAVFADQHMTVEKRVRGERTEVSASAISLERREGEIARMIGGHESEVSLLHAKEMLALAAARR
jgi:DNA repair protein RecN (Recombination protein N)